MDSFDSLTLIRLKSNTTTTTWTHLKCETKFDKTIGEKFSSSTWERQSTFEKSTFNNKTTLKTYWISSVKQELKKKNKGKPLGCCCCCFGYSLFFAIRQFYSIRSINFRSFVYEKNTLQLVHQCQPPARHLNRWRKWGAQAIITGWRWWTTNIIILCAHSIVSSHDSSCWMYTNSLKLFSNLNSKLSVFSHFHSTSTPNLLCLH